MADPANIEGVVRRRFRALKDECEFSKYAAHEAMACDLKDLRAARRVLDEFIDWLTSLHGQRKAEEAAGVWPACVREEQHG